MSWDHLEGVPSGKVIITLPVRNPCGKLSVLRLSTDPTTLHTPCSRDHATALPCRSQIRLALFPPMLSVGGQGVTGKGQTRFRAQIGPLRKRPQPRTCSLESRTSAQQNRTVRHHAFCGARVTVTCPGMSSPLLRPRSLPSVEQRKDRLSRSRGRD